MRIFLSIAKLTTAAGRLTSFKAADTTTLGVDDPADHRSYVVFFLADCCRRTAAISRSIWAMLSLAVPVLLALSCMARNEGGAGAIVLM